MKSICLMAIASGLFLFENVNAQCTSWNSFIDKNHVNGNYTKAAVRSEHTTVNVNSLCGKTQNPGYYNGVAWNANDFRGVQFGWYTSGEGIASKRTSGTNQNGIDFYTFKLNRMNITNGGDILMGYSNPNPSGIARVDIYNDARPTSLRIRHDYECGSGPEYIGVDNHILDHSTCDINIVGIKNQVENCGNGEVSGFINKVTPTSAVTEDHYGIKNTIFTAEGEDRARKTGLLNRVMTTTDNNDPVYGIYNDLNFGHSGNRWGIYNIMDNEEGDGHRTGIFTSTIGETGIALYARNWASAVDESAPIGGWAAWIEGDMMVTANFYNPSDANLKKNVENLEGSLDKLMALNPKTYDFKRDEYKDLGLPAGTQYGFIAQELEEVLPEIVTEIEHMSRDPKFLEQFEDATEVPVTNFKAVKYIPLIPVIVDAIQEQQEIIEEQDSKIADLESRLEALERLIEGATGVESTMNTDVKLQSHPNPANGMTTFSYSIPQNFVSAKILIRNINGQEVGSFNISTQEGNTEYNIADLKQGMYVYTLVVDGQVVKTEKLMVQE